MTISTSPINPTEIRTVGELRQLLSSLPDITEILCEDDSHVLSFVHDAHYGQGVLIVILGNLRARAT